MKVQTECNEDRTKNTKSRYSLGYKDIHYTTKIDFYRYKRKAEMTKRTGFLPRTGAFRSNKNSGQNLALRYFTNQ